MFNLRTILFVFCCALAFAAVEDKDGGVEFEVGGKPDKANIKTLFTKLKTVPAFDDTESSGDSDDNEKGSGDSEQGSGSGSGILDNDNEENGNIVTLPTVKPSGKISKATKAVPKSTVEVINEVQTTKTTTENNEILVNAGRTTDDNTLRLYSDNGGNDVDDIPSEPQKQQKSKDEGPAVNFTVGIIVGVVVGAILAILVIVFLVYRLRKKDEGSYSLDEPSSQAFIRDEKSNPGQGKEYYA